MRAAHTLEQILTDLTVKFVVHTLITGHLTTPVTIKPDFEQTIMVDDWTVTKLNAASCSAYSFQLLSVSVTGLFYTHLWKYQAIPTMLTLVGGWIRLKIRHFIMLCARCFYNPSWMRWLQLCIKRIVRNDLGNECSVKYLNLKSSIEVINLQVKIVKYSLSLMCWISKQESHEKTVSFIRLSHHITLCVYFEQTMATTFFFPTNFPLIHSVWTFTP